MAKVNIIMSVFNQEKYLEESINSILNQTYNDFTFIIINDGSTDNSVNIINSFNDKRIHFVHNEGNKGLIYSLNRGIDIALQSGCDYIARMDSDDIALPNRLLLQVNYLNENKEVGLLGGGMEFFGENIPNKNRFSPITHKKIVATFYCVNPFFHPTIIFRKHLVAQKRYSENFPKYEDCGLWIDLIGDCLFHNLPQVLLKYRRHSSNVTNAYKSEILHDQQIGKRLLVLLKDKLNVDLNDDEIEILTILSNAARALINPNITLKKLKETILNVVKKHDSRLVDKKYLRQILIERAILYLKTNNRKKEILSLVLSLRAFKEAYYISMWYITGKR